MTAKEEWSRRERPTKRSWRRSSRGDPAVVIRLCRASHKEAFETFGREAPIFEDRGYGVDSVTWAPGEWDASTAMVATLLLLVGIGTLFIAYMLVVRPPGTLVVIFSRAAMT